MELVKFWLRQRGMEPQFESQRKERERLTGKSVSETEAAEKFIQSMLPGGDRFEYLRLGQLGHVDGNTIWVHGGVNDRNYGRIPGVLEQEMNPKRWIDHLNAWGQAELEKMAVDFRKDGKAKSVLTLYGDAVADPVTKAVYPVGSSVVYVDKFRDGSNVRLPPDEVIERLQRYGIDQVIVGHIPMGNVPVPLKKGNFLYFMADTSYSEMGGNSYTVLRDGHLNVHATLESGARVDLTVDRDDPKVGLLAGDFHIIGKTKDGDFVLFQYYDRHKIKELIVSADQLHQYQLREPTLSGNSEVEKSLQALNQFFVEKNIAVSTVPEVIENLKARGKQAVLFSGSSKFTNNESIEPMIRREVRKMLQNMDPLKQTIITGGTDFGVEKIVHEEVDYYNALTKGPKFEMGAFIVDRAIPTEVHLTHNWVVYAGHGWEEPLMRGVEVVKDTSGKAIFIGGGGYVSAGIKKAAAFDADFRLMNTVPEGASLKFSSIYPMAAFSSADQIDFKSDRLLSVKQTPDEVKASFRASGKKVLTLVGFSGAGYENPAEVERIVKSYLKELNPKEWIINIGVTPDGIGQTYQWAKELDKDPVVTAFWKYAKEFKDAGFETRGVVSSRSLEYLKDPRKLAFIDNKTNFEFARQYVDAFHIIDDPSWGGYVNGKLSPVSETMVGVSDMMVGIGGGAVGRDELIEGILRHKDVRYHALDMNHQIALTKAIKQGKPVPTDFRGEAHGISEILKLAKPIRCLGGNFERALLSP